MNKEDVSKFDVEHTHDWSLPKVRTECIFWLKLESFD